MKWGVNIFGHGLSGLKKERNLQKKLCNLENKYFVSKTIQKLVIDENVTVDDQKEILKQTKQFHEKLYKTQDCLKKVNLSTEIPYNDIPKLTEIIGRGN